MGHWTELEWEFGKRSRAASYFNLLRAAPGLNEPKRCEMKEVLPHSEYFRVTLTRPQLERYVRWYQGETVEQRPSLRMYGDKLF